MQYNLAQAFLLTEIENPLYHDVNIPGDFQK